MPRRFTESPMVPLFAAMLALIVAITVGTPTGAAADARSERIEAALQLAETFEIVADEGQAYGKDIAAQFLDGDSGSWQGDVRRIYAPARTYPLFRARFDAEIGALPADQAEAILAFLESDLGREVVSLEVSARRAMLDPAVEDASLLRLDEMRETRDPRLGLIEEFISVNDLIEENVSGAMNANLAFYRGLLEGGAFRDDMTEADMLRDVWSQEESIRHETTRWVLSTLVLAYAPLSDDDIRAYVTFSKSEAGQHLNRALFDSFDVVFTEVSGRLGLAAARVLTGQDI